MHAVVKDWRSVSFDSVDTALCEFAAKLTHNNSKVSDSDLNTLRNHGLDDRTIHDAIQVIAYFNYITRVADATGVIADYDRAWG